MEKWERTIREDFPNKMLFWIEISGIPIHYKKDETYRNIGKALGEVEDVDVDGGRVQVYVNVDEPLQFERRAGFANGDVIRVTLSYENLHRHCFTCKRISHEEGTCPNLTDQQKEQNRIARIEKHDLEEKATRESFSVPQHLGLKHGRVVDQRYEKRQSYGREQNKREQDIDYRNGPVPSGSRGEREPPLQNL